MSIIYYLHRTLNVCYCVNYMLFGIILCVCYCVNYMLSVTEPCVSYYFLFIFCGNKINIMKSLKRYGSICPNHEIRFSTWRKVQNDLSSKFENFKIFRSRTKKKVNTKMIDKTKVGRKKMIRQICSYFEKYFRFDILKNICRFDILKNIFRFISFWKIIISDFKDKNRFLQ